MVSPTHSLQRLVLVADAVAIDAVAVVDEADAAAVADAVAVGAVADSVAADAVDAVAEAVDAIADAIADAVDAANAEAAAASAAAALVASWRICSTSFIWSEEKLSEANISNGFVAKCEKRVRRSEVMRNLGVHDQRTVYRLIMNIPVGENGCECGGGGSTSGCCTGGSICGSTWCCCW